MSASRTQSRTRSIHAAGSSRDELRNYQLHERVGLDELATVYRATHLGLDRPVFISILRRTDDVSVRRFHLAARLAARLDHPHLLPVIDAGQDDQYGDYLVTPHFEAHTLDAILSSGALDPLLVLRIATQIGSVLDYLHASGIVHRDVQPANVLVSPQGVAYLTNLSLAAGPDTPDLSGVLEADYLTPYTAPELRLDQDDATAALDVYGLGAVIYHMFSGDPPQVPGIIPPPLADNAPDLAEVDQVLQRMLAEDPSARFASLSSAIAALRQALRTQIDQSTEDMEESTWQPGAEWLENPLETVLGDMLDQDFLKRSRKRADDIHRANTLRRLLNRWSRKGTFRRAGLGQLVQPEQIVSYNIYFYALRTLYETRTAPQPHQKAQTGAERTATLPIPPVWTAQVIDVPPLTEITEVPAREVVLENSMRVFTCPQCGGVSQVVCPTCKGANTVERTRRVRNTDGSSGQETITVQCPDCRGYGRQTCSLCKGSGNLVEEQVFTFARHARLWENTDDIEGLPRLALQQRLEKVYEAPINAYKGQWHSVAPLAELLRSAVSNLNEDTRLVAATLSIHGTPITEVEYQFNDTPYLLYIIGFDNEIFGDLWALLNPERLALVVIVVALTLLALIAAVLVMLG